jgi:predicted transcriptional regulator
MSSQQIFYATQEFDLAKSFGVKLDPTQHRALLEIAQQRKMRRNRLIREAVNLFLAQSQNVEPPAV